MKKALLVIMFLVIAISLSYSVALASYNHEFDFTMGPSGWDQCESYPGGSWVSGVGWVSGVVENEPGVYRNRICIDTEFDLTHVSDIGVYVDYLKGTVNIGTANAFGMWAYDGEAVIASVSLTFNQMPADDDDWFYELEVDDEIDQIAIYVYASRAATEEAADSGHAIIYNAVVSSDDELSEDPFSSEHTKPIPESDILEYEIRDALYGMPRRDHIFAEVGTPVHAAWAGEITFYGIDDSGYYIAIEQANGWLAEYWGLKTVNVARGDIVSEGCVLGLLGKGDQSIEPADQYTDEVGVLEFWAFDSDGSPWQKLDWSTWFDNDSPVSCTSSLTTTNCVNLNPNLDDFAIGWDTQPPAEWPDGPIRVESGVDLHHGESIEQYLVLDDEEDWYVTLATYVSNNSSGGLYDLLDVHLGEDGEGIVITPDYLGAQETDEVGPLAIGDPDYAPDIYLLKIESTWYGTGGIRIDFACVHTGDVVMADTPYCYLANASFDEGSTGWDESASGVSWHPIGVNNPNLGAVVLQPGAWIEQAIDLPSYDGEDADYYLSIDARVALAEEGTIGDIWDGLTATVHHTVETEVADLGDHDVNNVLISLGYMIDFTVTDGNTLTGDLRLENDSLSEAEVEFQQVCIRPTRGVWPWEVEGETDQTPDYGITCAGCTMPTEILALGAWIDWLFCQIGVIYFCHLKPLLLTGLQWFKNITDGLGFLGRWMSVLLVKLATWLQALIVDFGKAIGDAILSMLAAAWNLVAALDIMQALYDMIGYVTAFLTGVFSAIISIGSLVVDGVNILLTFGRVIAIFWNHLYAALNGSAETLGLPSCETPESAIMVGWCVGIELIVGIVDEFPALSLSFVLIAGCVGLVTMIWTTRQIGGAMGNV